MEHFARPEPFEQTNSALSEQHVELGKPMWLNYRTEFADTHLSQISFRTLIAQGPVCKGRG